MDKKYYKIVEIHDGIIRVSEKYTNSRYTFTIKDNIDKLNKFALYDCLEVSLEMVGIQTKIVDVVYLGQGTKV